MELKLTKNWPVWISALPGLKWQILFCTWKIALTMWVHLSTCNLIQAPLRYLLIPYTVKFSESSRWHHFSSNGLTISFIFLFTSLNVFWPFPPKIKRLSFNSWKKRKLTNTSVFCYLHLHSKVEMYISRILNFSKNG